MNGTTEDAAGPTSDLSMDLTHSDLSFVDGKSVGSLVIGYDAQSYARATGATSNVPIEVQAGWQLTANTELRSSNQLFTASNSAPAPTPVYGSITVKGVIDGGGYNLSLICESNLALNGGPGSISNVNTLTIQPFALNVSIRIADPAPNADALVVGPSSFSAIGNTVQKLFIERSDSTAHLVIAGPIQLPTDTTLITNANVTVQSRVDGQSLLTINAGITQLSASLGSETPLKGINVNYNAKTGERTVIEDLNGAAVQIRTSQDQIFSEDIELLKAVTFEAVGRLTLARSLKAGANALCLYADELFVSTTQNSITGTGALTLGQGNASTPIAINSASLADMPGREKSLIKGAKKLALLKKNAFPSSSHIATDAQSGFLSTSIAPCNWLYFATTSITLLMHLGCRPGSGIRCGQAVD